jgi:hypothetical protein
MSDFTEVAANQGADISEVGNELQILASLAPTFTFASHQNCIPVVRSIRIELTTDKSLDDLELTARPPFLRPKTWIVDRVLAGETEETVALSDQRVDLDTAYLAGLNKAERSNITLAASPRRNPPCRDRRPRPAPGPRRMGRRRRHRSAASGIRHAE